MVRLTIVGTTSAYAFRHPIRNTLCSVRKVNPVDSSSVLISHHLLEANEVDVLTGVWHDFGTYRPSSADRTVTPPSKPQSPIGRVEPATFFRSRLAGRFDASRNFTATGGRFGRHAEGPDALNRRTDYFRETYASGSTVSAHGIEFLMRHEALSEHARSLYGAAFVVPMMIYANVLTPGQELGLHTDVPEFRILRGTVLPPWLKVVMCHSHLFDDWRLRVATAVLYTEPPGVGGEFVYYPEGPNGRSTVTAPDRGMSVMFDADTVFHGIDRVGSGSEGPPDIGAKSRLTHMGNRQWALGTPKATEAQNLRSEDLRFSVSWKALCFADPSEHTRWRRGVDGLSLEQIVHGLLTELARRGRLHLPEDRLTNEEFGILCVDEFVRFPPPTESAGDVRPLH